MRLLVFGSRTWDRCAEMSAALDSIAPSVVIDMADICKRGGTPLRVFREDGEET